MSQQDPVPDDPSIDDEDRVLRALPPQSIREDGSEPKSGGFQCMERDGKRGMSVFLSSVLAEQGLEEESVIYVFEGHALVAIPVAAVRRANLGIVRDPREHEDPRRHAVMQAHAHVVTFPDRTTFTGGQMKALRKASVPVVWPGSSFQVGA